MELMNVEVARANVTETYNAVREDILYTQIPDYVAELNRAITEASKKGCRSVGRNLPRFNNTDLGKFSSECFIDELAKIIRNAGYTIQYHPTLIIIGW